MKVIVTAGPTREYIDPVRFLSNRSTGKMGFALAEAAQAEGYEVVLIAGPVNLDTPSGVCRVDVVSAREMLAVIERELDTAHILIMAAAVADWRPKETARQKLKKSSMNPVLELEANPDILKTIREKKGNRIFVGFAAETEHLEEEAQRKLQSKGLDYICANDVSRADAGFGVDTNAVTIYTADGKRVSLPFGTKREVAKEILKIVRNAPY